MGILGRIFVLAAVIGWGTAGSARAQEVRWEGQCAAEGAGLPGEVAALVGVDVEALTATVAVSGGEGPLHLQLVLSRDGASIGERAIDAATCAELVSAAALVVALAVDPETRAAESAPTPSRSMANPLAQALAPPPARAAASLDRPARSAASNDAIRRARGRAIVPDADPDFEAPTRTESPAAPWRPEPSIGFGLALDVGALPNAAPGLEARVGLSVGMLRLEGGARVFFEQEAGLGQHLTGRGHYGMAAGSLGACLPLSYGAVSVGPCVGLEVGAIWAKTTGVTDPGGDTTPWVAPGASGLLALDVASWLRLRLDLGITVPLVRTEFVVDGIGPVHAPSAVTFRGGLGAEVHFR